MTMTVEEGFRKFHGRLTPSSGESDKARSHRSSIEACLKANFGITRFFRSGSFGNGTSISGYSDVDYFASIPREKLTQKSSSTLKKVRDVLDNRFTYTDVTVRTPGILVPFGSNPSESTEVVPADFIKRDNDDFHIYEIADGSGGWKRTSPDAHNTYVTYNNKELRQKLKPLIRFLKAWKYFKEVPISSFYLELRAAKYASSEESIVYSIDIKNILISLWKNQLAAVQDPMGISGYIGACSTDTKKKTSLSKLDTAMKRAIKARDAEQKEKTKDAFYWWGLLFDGQFPAFR